MYLRPKNRVLLRYPVLLLVLIFLGACQNNAKKSIEQQALQKSYLALGDSYTIGESVPEEMRWPNQLVAQLNGEQPLYQNPTLVARTGWTTDELLAAIESRNFNAPYDVVSLMIGVNNQYRGRSLENFRQELITLLEQTLVFSGNNHSKVFVLSIPDWGVTPFAEGRDRNQIAQEIDAFNAVIREECTARNIAFFDITPISRLAKNDASLLAEDGLHPSGLMYQLWVNELISFFNE